jgi:Ca2+-binding RTX toxin-like protein
MAIINGTNNNDTLTMTNGVDTVSAFAGFDTIKGGAYLTAQDKIDGGGDYDTIELAGDYSVQTVFTATTLTNVEQIVLAGGLNDYSFKTHDGTISAGGNLVVSTFGAAGQLFFDASAEKDGRAFLEGFSGDDSLTGGLKNDAFLVSAGGVDTIFGGAGDDTASFGAALTAADRYTGGSGYDSLFLDSAYQNGLTFGANTLLGVEEIVFNEQDGGYAMLVAHENMVINNGVMKVRFLNGGGGANQAVAFDAGAETNGRYDFTGGTGDDILIGGAKNDMFNLRWGGDDAVSGGKGDDEFGFEVGYTSADFVDGGSGVDRVSFGALSGATTLSGANFKNIEIVAFTNSGQATRTVVTADSFVAADATLQIQGGYLTGGQERLVWNGAAETDGHFLFNGGDGADVLIGGAQDDSFDLREGGADNLVGGAGEDYFSFDDKLTAQDRIDGGADRDSVALSGDYSQGVAFDSLTMRNVEYLSAQDGFNYKLAFHDGTIKAGETLEIGAHYLKTTDWLKIDGSAETDGALEVNAALTFRNAGTSIRAGSGLEDSVSIHGDYSAGKTFTATTLTGVEELGLGSGFSYKLTTHDATVAAGATLEIFALYIGAGHTLTFDGSAETNGSFDVSTGAGDDWVLGGAAGDTISSYYEGGDDTFEGAGGDDLFDVGSNLSMAGDSVDGGAGYDTVELIGGATLQLGTGVVDDVEHLFLRDGGAYKFTVADGLLGAGETMKVYGYILGAADKLTFSGLAETDGSFEIIGGLASDLLIGGEKTDTIDGGLGDDTLNGREGDDLLEGGAGGDSLVGGAGYDTAIYLDSSAVSISLKAGVGGGGQAAGDIYVSIENLTGGYYSDKLTGSDGANVLNGDGNADTLRGGLGADTLIGGWGNDTADYAGSAAIVVDLLSESASGGQAEGDALFGVENILGTSFADVIVGDGYANLLKGAPGKDTLMGDAGADTLDGGIGNDTLNGGAQGDVFAFSGASWGADTLQDFVGGVDLIDLRDAGYTFADLTIVYADGDATITTSRGSILLENVASGLGEGDFLFA